MTTPALPDRIRARYPRRHGRTVAVVLALVLGGLLVAWVVWTGLYHALPPVSGRVSSYRVVSDGVATAVLTVERPDPSVVGSCTVIAQSDDFRRVGQLTVTVPASTVALADLPVEVRTIARAVSVSLLTCSPAG